MNRYNRIRCERALAARTFIQNISSDWNVSAIEFEHVVAEYTGNDDFLVSFKCPCFGSSMLRMLKSYKFSSWCVSGGYVTIDF